MRIRKLMTIYLGITLILIGVGTATPSANSVNDNDNITVPTSATVSINPSLIPASGYLKPGDGFQVSVEVDSGISNLRGITFFIDYDNSALQLNNASYEQLLGSEVLIIERPSPGGYLFALGVKDLETISIRKGTLLTLEFEVRNEAIDGVYNLEMNGVALVNEKNELITDIIVNDSYVLTTGDPFTAIKVVSDPGPLPQGGRFQAVIEIDSYGYSLNDIALQLNYDPDAFMVTNITYGKIFGVNTLIAPESEDNKAGMIRYKVSSNESSSAPVFANLININFEVKNNASEGTYKFDLKNVLLTGEDNSVIPDTLIVDTAANVSIVKSTIIENDEGTDTEESETEIVGIILEPGWNLISFPDNLNESSIYHILQDFSETEVDAVFYDDSYSGTMLVPDEFEALKGYWVHNNMSEPITIDKLYLDPKVPSHPASLTLYPGWNAIGHTAKFELPAEYALFTIDNSYTKVKGPWISSENDYAFVGFNDKQGSLGENMLGEDIFNMSMYNGYYVFVENECVLA